MLENLKRTFSAVAIVVLVLGVQNAFSADDDKPVDTTKPTDAKPDNTKTNKRDRDPNEVTAGDQKQNKSDIEITAKIRQMVVKDDSLSTNAHNVKIITVDGMVTLKGPVKSDVEKATVEKHAMHIVGDEKKITNQIEIAP